MKLIKRTLLCLGVAAMFPVYAANVQMTNSQFDATTLADNASTANIHGWSNNSGIAGLINPDHSLFLGEQGLGAHRNTLYMIDNASVSQTLNFRTLLNSTFTLSFDVGQRADVSNQNYTVRVTAGDETLLEVYNPKHANEPGKFASAEVTFTNKDVVGELMQLTIETEGTGHVYFDNFTLQYEQAFQRDKAALRPIAYGIESLSSTSNSPYCYRTQSLSDDVVGTYLKSQGGTCYCAKGELIVIDEDYDILGGFTRHLICALTSID